MMSRELFIDGEGSDFDGISLPLALASPPSPTPASPPVDGSPSLPSSASPDPSQSALRSSARHVPASSKILNVRSRVPGTIRTVDDVEALKLTQRVSSPPTPTAPSPAGPTLMVSPPPSPAPAAALLTNSSIPSVSQAGLEPKTSLPMFSSVPSLPSRGSKSPSVACSLVLELLTAPNVDMARLRKASWSGIPLEARAMVWKLLLGYLPSNRERREGTLERKRQEYGKFVQRYFSDTASTERDDEERDLLHQINIDVLRTHPNCPLFRNQHIQNAMERILFIWSMRHPASGYVQGINELVTPFLVVFLYDELIHSALPSAEGGADASERARLERRSSAETTDIKEWLQRTADFDPSLLPLELIEADAYGCLDKLLSNVQTHYTFAQPGIQRMLYKLEVVMKRIDAALCQHLEKQQTSFLVLCFRWMNCYLMREIPLHHITRMWDTYMCEDDGFSTFHVYVCAAFLSLWSQKLQACDFQGIMLFVQSLPTDDWTNEDLEMLLSKAFMLKAQHEPHVKNV